jgi:hypothetical protein
MDKENDTRLFLIWKDKDENSTCCTGLPQTRQKRRLKAEVSCVCCIDGEHKAGGFSGGGAS